MAELKQDREINGTSRKMRITWFCDWWLWYRSTLPIFDDLLEPEELESSQQADSSQLDEAYKLYLLNLRFFSSKHRIVRISILLVLVLDFLNGVHKGHKMLVRFVQIWDLQQIFRNFDIVLVDIPIVTNRSVVIDILLHLDGTSLSKDNFYA